MKWKGYFNVINKLVHSSKEKGKFEIKYPCVCLQLTVVATHDWIGGNRKGIDIFRFLHLLLLTEHGRQTSFMWPWLSDNSEIMKKVFWPRCCSVAPLLEHNVAELT